MEETKDNAVTAYYHHEPLKLQLNKEQYMRMLYAPRKNEKIASFKIRMRGRNVKATYAHKVTFFEHEGQLWIKCSNPDYQDDRKDGGCRATDFADELIASIIKSPETAAADLRAWVASGGDLQTIANWKLAAKR